ncbi:MAG: hypothetical protein QHC90_21055 [Shinella sp.]|nr:hypothetical protein [Shinella sp.]
MTVRIKILAALAALLGLSALPATAENLIADPIAEEKISVGARCKAASFAEDFAVHVDFNNDGLEDVITNLGAVSCDGKPAGLCRDVGCPHNFYIQVSEGGYFFAANADLYGYDLATRYGNRVLELKADAVSCGREGPDYCIMTIRVRGARFETISKK